jgi:hypothetical protein
MTKRFANNVMLRGITNPALAALEVCKLAGIPNLDKRSFRRMAKYCEQVIPAEGMVLTGKHPYSVIGKLGKKGGFAVWLIYSSHRPAVRCIRNK